MPIARSTLLLPALALSVGIAACSLSGSGSDAVAIVDDASTTTSGGATTTEAPTTTTTTEPTTTTRPPYDGWSDPTASGLPWSAQGAVEGLLTFRGNPTRSWYGEGPVPADPEILWTHDIGCSNSPVGGENKTWCGSGWTGQPAVFTPPGGTPGEDWWLAFGAYDREVNFLDPATGAEAYPAYPTDDIIKGTVTIDPDGFPLLYTGSRDNRFHVVALDRPDGPEALWRLDAEAVQPTRWNNDWDGSALVFDDYLIEGGENSRFFVVKLNRAYDADGRVTVDPTLVFSTESWDDRLADETSSRQYSIENSVVVVGETVYWANSAGLIQGWDLSAVPAGGEPTQVLRYWAGDDIDASLVADAEGFLYAGVEYELGNARSEELGQVLKLDPRNPDDPLVWGTAARTGRPSGVWATPALWGDLVIVATDDGRVLGLDRADGSERWSLDLPGPLWSSPVIVDDVLVQGDCEGSLNAFDLDPVAAPSPRWSIFLGGCIESTPAVYLGGIFVGSRDGTFYAVGDRP